MSARTVTIPKKILKKNSEPPKFFSLTYAILTEKGKLISSDHAPDKVQRIQFLFAVVNTFARAPLPDQKEVKFQARKMSNVNRAK